MSNKKIWSVPLVVVTALLLVGLFAASVLAQATNAAPIVGSSIDDVEITIGSGASSPGTQPDLTGAFTDSDAADTIVYTAATSNERVADVALSGDTTTVVTAWWDRLGGVDAAGAPNTNGTDPDTDCSKRAAVLGFTAGAGIRGTPPSGANPNRAGLAATESPIRAAVQATGFCQDFGDLTTAGDDTRTATAEETDFNAQQAVIDAFHWDMLTGGEMIAVATSANEGNPNAYGKKFGGLSLADQATVSSWFTTGFLARGTGTLAVSNDGIAPDTDNNDLPGTGPFGEEGTATIYVRASDFVGRFVTGANTSNAAGQSFTVTASLTPTQAITDFIAETSAPAVPPTETVVSATGVSGTSTGVNYVAANTAVTPPRPHRYDITISADAEGTVAQVHAVTGAGDLMIFHEKIEFLLRGDDRFQIKRTGALQTADIVVKSGSSLTRDEVINLKLQVNEKGNVGANIREIDLRVKVVSGGEAPMLDTAALDAHFAANPVKVREHMAEDENVVTSGLPVDFGDFASHGGGQAIRYEISPADSYLTINEDTGVVTLKDPTAGVEYETGDDPDNSDKFTVTADDRTRTVTYKFDVAITTNKAKANHNLDSVTRAGDPEAEPPVPYTYTITATSDLRQDDRGKVVIDLMDYIMGVDDPGTLDYSIVSSKSEFAIGSTPGDSEISLNYVPDPDVVDYGSVNADGMGMLSYTGDDALTVSIDDGYDTQKDDDDNDVPDLIFTINLTVSIEPPPAQQYPVIQARINENETGVLVSADNSDLVSVRGDEPVTFRHEGGSGKGILGASTFSVDEDTGAVTVNESLDFEMDGPRHTLAISATRDRDEQRVGFVTVEVTVVDVNEKPEITNTDTTAYISEDAQMGNKVQTGPSADNDSDYKLTVNDAENDSVTFSIEEKGSPFNIDSDGNITLSRNGVLDHETKDEYTLTITANDGELDSDDFVLKVEVGDSNEAPFFTHVNGDDTATNPLDGGDPSLTITRSESIAVGTEIADFEARDLDGDVLEFTLKNQNDTSHFALDKLTGVLTIASRLDYETQEVYLVEVNVEDPQEAQAEIQLTINLINENDEAPDWDVKPVKVELNLAENTSRGTVLANYSATDPDNLAAGIAYSLTGASAKSFNIMKNGDLVTLESIDHDSATPCAGNVCNITVNANDGAQSLSADVRITIIDAEDSISTLDIRKANPVPGPNAGLPDSALSGAKTTINPAVPERPADLPATITDYDLDNDGTRDNITDAVNFVETEWANWGTVLLIEITSESPDSDCGNGNQCVVVDLESDSADDKLSVIAYRSAHDENKFLAAVKLVGRSASAGDGTSDPAYLMPTSHYTPGGIRPRDMGATPGEAPVYKHTDGSVARLQVDEEDEINIGFGNLRDSVDVENDPPEIESFAPAHESAFDNADVDYSFRVTDGLSGIPDPEDLPDGDGDGNYIPVIAVVSGMQCERPEVDIGNNRKIRADSAQCNDKRGIHEYDATTAARADWGYIAVREDKDFDEIDNGYEVETTLVLDEDKLFYVTFVVVDRAGNMAYFDPDGSDDEVEYAEIVIDVDEPDLYEARAGVSWDEGDEEYDDDRSVIQVIFNDLTELNPATVEIDDFVVEGHTIVAVNVYEQPDNWSDTSRYATGGELRYRNADGLRLRQSIETSVFLHLEDELQADETPDVTLVPNGIEDVAGNEQDDGEAEADDWISPSFTIVSIVSPRETTENPDVVLAGDGDEVVFNVTVDERLSTARPTVTVSYVDAASVDTKGTATCDNGDGDSDLHDGKRKRGEITRNTSGESSGLCANNDLATDHNLKTTVEKVTNTEWIITVGEPKGTGYYNFHIAGKDRSAQQNPGSEGVDPDSIVTDFYDSDGDVNMDDAVYYQGDINLPKPNVRLGGVSITDNEPSVEYRSRLFLEIDFTRRYEDAVACENLPSLSDNYRLANCMNENSEYAEDNFDDIVVTSFVLDGVDITDSVKTTDDQTFLVTLENIGLGDHEVEIQAMDQAGNELEDPLEIDFEVSDRDPFEKRLSPGWNLISLPGEPADSSIASVIGSDVEVRTVYTYNPIVPGGWQVAVRETLDSEWQGDLTEITGQRGYWVLSDAIQDWEVNIPRLAGGAVGTGTPIQPPVIPLYAGWNLIPVTDVKGNALDHNTPIDASIYLQSLEDGIEAARVLGFDTIRNEWYTVLDGDMMSPGMGTNLLIGSGYWVFVRNATALVPGGVAGSGGSSD